MYVFIIEIFSLLSHCLAPTVSKLEDVKIDYESTGVDSELDQFFSSKPMQFSDENIELEEKEENTITYLDDEIPDFM
jgi:hypothetical protein